MITPLDISKKEFTKSVRGYKEEEVDSFLDLIALDVERLIEENKRMHESIRTLTSEVEHHRNSESSVLDTLTAAKGLMREISESAERRAEMLLKNAELDAERIQREARESVERLTEEALTLEGRWNMFKTRYRNLLESELERFSNVSADFFPESELEDLRKHRAERQANMAAIKAGAAKIERAASESAASENADDEEYQPKAPEFDWSRGNAAAQEQEQELLDDLTKTITNFRFNAQ